MQRPRKVQNYSEVRLTISRRYYCQGPDGRFDYSGPNRREHFEEIEDRCQLPNGVIAEKWASCDRFWGSREALIEAGFAKPEWFPAVFPPGKNKGTCQMDFTAQDEGRSIGLTRFKKGAPRVNRWYLRIELTAAEKARREAQEGAVHQQQEADEMRRQRRQAEAEAKDEQRKEAAREERLRTIVEQLPPFVPGSMSEFEKHLMRLVRGLDPRLQLQVCELVKLYLDAPFESHSDPEDDPEGVPSTPAAGLTLVVDNTCRK